MHRIYILILFFAITVPSSLNLLFKVYSTSKKVVYWHIIKQQHVYLGSSDKTRLFSTIDCQISGLFGQYMVQLIRSSFSKFPIVVLLSK